MRGLAAIPTMLVACAALHGAEPQPARQPSAPDADALYNLGQQLFDEYAPPEVKQQYAYPSKQQWDAFAARLEGALQGNSVSDLAAYAPQARAALAGLRALGTDDALADWLEQRLDELEAAQQVQAASAARGAAAPGPAVPAPTARPPAAPGIAPVPPPHTAPAAPPVQIPYYNLWLQRVRSRPAPAQAQELMPILRSAFAAEGVPPALAWIAEAESSFDPHARSPAGAKGLFQLMPDTAKKLGLDTFLPDERTDPAKSARAAAKYLRELHDRFGTWPLSLAAYNAGEGRVSHALAAHHATSFAAIANALPAETRMYVPKVCALVAVRSGHSIAGL